MHFLCVEQLSLDHDVHVVAVLQEQPLLRQPLAVHEVPGIRHWKSPQTINNHFRGIYVCDSDAKITNEQNDEMDETNKICLKVSF